METIVQFLRCGDVFMARGQRHIVANVHRDGARRKVYASGKRQDGQFWEAIFDWGETVETVDRVIL